MDEQSKQRKFGAMLSYANILSKNLVYMLYTPFLLKFLGKADYGIYQLTSQVVATLSMLTLGLSGAYVRYYWIEKKESDNGVSNLNGLYLIIFGVVALIALVIGLLFSYRLDLVFGQTFSLSELETARKLMAIMVVNISLTFISNIFDSYIVANQKFIFQYSRALLLTILQPIFTIPMIMNGFGVVSIAIVQVILTAFFLVINMRFAFNKLNMRFSFSSGQWLLFKSLMVFSSFLLVNSLVDLINNNLPGVIVGALLGPISVSIYSIAIQIRSIFFQMSLALSNVFVPKVNEMISSGRNNDEMLDLMIKVGRIQLLILAFLYGGFVVVGQDFIEMWAGHGFSSSYWMIVIMTLPVLVPLSQNVGIEIQRAKNMHKFRSISLGILAIVNVLLTIWGIKYFGVMGSIFGYVFSIIVGNGLLMNWYNHTKVGLDMIKYWKRVFNIFIPTGLAILISSLLKLFIHVNPFYDFLVLGVAYSSAFLLIWYFLSATDEERNKIGIIQNKFRNMR